MEKIKNHFSSQTWLENINLFEYLKFMFKTIHKNTDICPICHNLKNSKLYNLDRGELVSCDHCQTIFYTPRPTLQELADYYNTSDYRQCYEDSAMTGQNFAQNRYKQLIEILNSYAPDVLSLENKKLLDVGCGVGDLLAIASNHGWDVTGTEISPEASMEANQKLNNRVLTGDLLNLDIAENSFDLITIYHVIKHLIEPVSILEKIHKLLKPGGVAFIETPNIASLGAKIKGKNWSHIIPPEHITYFKPSSLKYTLKKAGFEEFKVITNSPYIVESVQNWQPVLRGIANTIYQIAPVLGMGAALQGIATKNKS